MACSTASPGQKCAAPDLKKVNKILGRLPMRWNLTGTVQVRIGKSTSFAIRSRTKYSGDVSAKNYSPVSSRSWVCDPDRCFVRTDTTLPATSLRSSQRRRGWNA